MLRVSIRANPETDVNEETDALRRAAKDAGLEPGLIDFIGGGAHSVVRDFVNRGRELKALGSQFKAERTLRGDGYDIRVKFDPVQRPTVLGRVLAAFRR